MDWIRVEFGRPSIGGFLGGLTVGSFIGALGALATATPVMFVWVMLATGVVASLLVRPAH